MDVGLFIPCYVDQFYPQVGIATLKLLRQFGCKVTYPDQQTCCGQPLANSGMEKKAIPIYQHFVDLFSEVDYIVGPSASCAYHIQHHYDIIPQTKAVQHCRSRIYDICAFLTDVLQIDALEAHFPYRVGIHQSCHGLRGLRMARSSELQIPAFSKWQQLLGLVKDIELITLDRPDECCGFGGTFAIAEEAVSAKMGQDRIADHIRNGADFITSGDMSCLMHMEGLLKRSGASTRVKHITEILTAGSS